MSKLFLDLASMKQLGKSKEGKAVFEHKDGHQIHVDPSKLSPKLRGDLEAMAKGGKATKDPTQAHLMPGDSIPNAIEKKVVGGMHKKGLAHGGEVMGMLKAKHTGAANPKLAESKKEPMRFEAGGPVPSDDDSVGRISPFDPQAPQTDPSALQRWLTPGGNLQPQSGPPSPTMQDLQQDANSRAQDFVGPEQTADAAPTSQPPGDTNTSAAAAPPPADPSEPQGVYMQGLDEARKGAQQQYQAESGLGKAQMANYADQSAGIQAQTDLMQQTQHLTQHETQEYQNLQHDVQNNLIDPQHYLHDMSSAGKVATAFGLIAGGIGSGITGQPNAAMQYLNNQIDRDITAQQHNLGTRESLLSANMKHYANMREAQDMTRIQMQGVLAAKMGQAAAQQSDPAAKARLLQAKSQIDMNAAPQLFQFSMRKTLMNNLGSNNNVPQQVQMLRMMGNEPMAKDLESRYVPNVGVAKVPVPQEVRDKLTGMQAFQDQAGKLADWSQRHSGDLSPTNINYGRALASSVAGAYRQASHGGVFKEGEQQYINGLVDQDPTKFMSNVRVVPKLRAIQDSMATDQKALHDSVGLPPPMSAQPAAQYKISGGIKYMRGPKGEAIPVGKQ